MYRCLTRTLDRRLSSTTVNRPPSFDLNLFDIKKKNVGEEDATLSHPPLSHILHPLHTLHKFAMVYISFQAVAAAAVAGALFPVTKTTSTAANLHIAPIRIFTTLLSYWRVGLLTQMLLQILRPSSLSSSQRDRTRTCQ